MDDAKITLEVIYDALFEKNSKAMNYERVTNVASEKDGMQIITTENQIDHSSKIFQQNKLFIV